MCLAVVCVEDRLSQIQSHIWPVFERNAIVRLFSDMGSHIHSCQSLPLSTIALND